MFKTNKLMFGLVLVGMTGAWSLGNAKESMQEVKQVFTSQAAVLAKHAPVMAITNNGQQMIAVGARGHVLTSDGKADWSQILVPTDVLLTDVEFFGEENGWSVGHDATILHTNDGGVSWVIQQQIPALDRPLLDVDFVSPLRGFAIGAYGMFYGTIDGGKTWTKQFLQSLLPEEDVEYLAEVREESEEDYQSEIASILPHFNKIIELNDQRLMLVGELGLIAFSNDLGKSWQRIENVYEGSFFTGAQLSSGAILVGGLRGNMFRSMDNGVNWSKVDLGNSNSINDIYQLKNGDVLVAQNNGTLLISKDDGVNFTQLSLQKGQDLMDIHQIQNQIWLAGSKGLNVIKGSK